MKIIIGKLKKIDDMLRCGLISKYDHCYFDHIFSGIGFSYDITKNMLDFFDGETTYEFIEKNNIYYGPGGFIYSRKWIMDKQDEKDIEFNNVLDELINQPWVDWEDIK